VLLQFVELCAGTHFLIPETIILATWTVLQTTEDDSHGAAIVTLLQDLARRSMMCCGVTGWTLTVPCTLTCGVLWCDRVDPDSSLHADMQLMREKEGFDHILFNFTFKVSSTVYPQHSTLH